MLQIGEFSRICQVSVPADSEKKMINGHCKRWGVLCLSACITVFFPLDSLTLMEYNKRRLYKTN